MQLQPPVPLGPHVGRKQYTWIPLGMKCFSKQYSHSLPDGTWLNAVILSTNFMSLRDLNAKAEFLNSSRVWSNKICISFLVGTATGCMLIISAREVKTRGQITSKLFDINHRSRRDYMLVENNTIEIESL